MALDAWNIYIKRTDTLFDALTDEQLHQEVSQGRNTGVYLLGHLASVHDMMLPLLGFEKQVYPELQDPFVESPDKSGKPFPEVSVLRAAWKDVNTRLSNHFAKMQPDDWFTGHTAISPGDFQKEPHRNKLNVIINRTNHLTSHYGQLVFLKK